MISIKNWPENERPREKLVKQGAGALSDAELLAIILCHGTKGKTAIELAHDLLNNFGGIRGIFGANYLVFKKMHGLGIAKYTQLQACLELSRRHLLESIQRKGNIEQSQDAKDFLISSLRGHEHEVFACLFLDSQHRVIQFEKLFFGSINCASVHPREVVKKALFYNAAAVILAHNHPSGEPEPSHADKEITYELVKALSLVDITILDHFVIGDTSVVSFADRGWI